MFHRVRSLRTGDLVLEEAFMLIRSGLVSLLPGILGACLSGVTHPR
jgi:hypothetical protein